MDLLCLHQTKTARPQMQNERGRGDRPAAASFPGGHIQPCLFPRLPAAGEPGRATQGQTATEGQGSEREETQTHGEVRRELTVAGSRLNSLGEQHKSSGFPPQACPRLDPLVSLSRNPSLCRLRSVAHVRWQGWGWGWVHGPQPPPSACRRVAPCAAAGRTSERLSASCCL